MGDQSSPKKGMASLYSELWADVDDAPPEKNDAKAPATEAGVAKKKTDAFQYQHIKRPQAQQKGKPKPGFASARAFPGSGITPSADSASSPGQQSSTARQPPQIPNIQQRSTFEDWVGNPEEDEYYLSKQEHKRGGKRGRQRKNREKREEGNQVRVWKWDDVYEIAYPNQFMDYNNSDAQYGETADWRNRLFCHKPKAGQRGRKDSRTNIHDQDQRESPVGTSADEYQERPASASSDRSYQSDVTGEDAYAHRARMSTTSVRSPPDNSSNPSVIPLGPTQAESAAAPATKSDAEAKLEGIQAKLAAFKAKMPEIEAQAKQRHSSLPGATSSSPPPAPPPPVPMAMSSQADAGVHPSAADAEAPWVVLSKAPVRFEVPIPDPPSPADEHMDTMSTDDAQENTSNSEPLPPTKGFGERMLMKLGWAQGQGLGAEGNEGITTAIVAKAAKRKKRSDFEGGGWAGPKNMGKIVGGKRRKLDEEDGASGELGEVSDVIKIEGMLDNLDVDDEIENQNLFQEIGDEFSGEHGNVERVLVWRKEEGGNNEVFLVFTSQLSAMRAVQDCNSGLEFAGNKVKARYWPADKFNAREFA